MAEDGTVRAAITDAPAMAVLDGMVELAAIREGRPCATGWFRPPAHFVAPLRLVLLLGGPQVDFGVLPTAPEDGSDRITFNLHRPEPWEVGATQIGPQSFIIRDARGQRAEVKTAPRILPLALFYRSRAQFFHHVQDPGRRHPDKETVAYHAKRYLDLHREDAVLAAAALTILGYRLLDATRTNLAGSEEVLQEAAPVLAALGDCDTEPKYRWFISLTMVCHYLQILNGNPGACLDQLRQIIAKRELVVTSPAQAGNTLKAIFHLGSALWKLGQREEAEEVLLTAKEIARSAGAVWRFTSWYSANEFVNAGQLTKACMLRLEMLHHADTGVWRDASYIAAAKDANAFACLGFPTAAMLKRGQI
jgi:hypothetical protein